MLLLRSGCPVKSHHRETYPRIASIGRRHPNRITALFNFAGLPSRRDFPADELRAEQDSRVPPLDFLYTLFSVLPAFLCLSPLSLSTLLLGGPATFLHSVYTSLIQQEQPNILSFFTMYLQTALLGSLLLASHASASSSKLNAVLQRSDDIEEILRRDADMMASLTRRQDANSAGTAPQVSTTPASGDAAKADLTKWEEETAAACGNAVAALNGQASNPTGLAVCYNLPFLDNTTGVFQAEVRMFNVSAPIDPWVGVSAAAISMTMSYAGATLQEMNGTFAKRGEIGFPSIQLREVASVEGMLVEKRQTTAVPTALKVMMYVGQINSNLMGSAMTQ